MNLAPHRKRSTRCGYALMTVSVFLVLMLTMTGVVHRQLSIALRIEQARIQSEERDGALIHAAARAMELLETGTPPSDPYVCATTINTSQGPESITVTFTNEAGNVWSVHAAPTGPSENPNPMPEHFLD